MAEILVKEVNLDRKKFEARAVLNVIAGKRIRGEGVAFEESLLKSWHEYEGWGEAIDACHRASALILSGLK